MMPPSPAKLRGIATTTSSRVQEDGDDRQFRSISVTDIHDVDDSNDIEVNTDSENEVPRDDRREEEQPMTKERRLAFKQLERWRTAMKKRSRSRRFRNRNQWNAKTQMYSEELEFDSVFGTSSTYGRELQVVSYPWPIWIFGIMIIVAASIFVLRVKSLNDESDLPSATWWKYLVAVVLYLVGFALIANGRVETFYMNKEESRFVLRSSRPLCLGNRYLHVVEHDMRQITNIRVETIGEHTGDIDTRTYKVHFDFDDGTHASVLETRSKQKAARRCRLIKSFAAAYPAMIAPMRSVSEQFQPTAAKLSPLRHVTTAPSKLSLE
ncbi:hypothetical protein PHYBOEH_009350 [Phytophthora boehmeriae]|uniref:Transmembrane protein n=1 Tax=Phytophthora boehmeriae TaxID=109152 RepID=A0A8T1VUP3_9STRA|nr:hypothetical protein PHYBOEH_009350 [Phytophthora boehmeriae]